MERHFLQQDVGQTDSKGLCIRAGDQISLIGARPRHMTVILDYVTARVVRMGLSRKAETLEAFCEGLTAAPEQAIQGVAMDEWEAFIKSVQRHRPQAKIVFDLVHLVQTRGQVVDEVRHQEYKKFGPASGTCRSTTNASTRTANGSGLPAGFCHPVCDAPAAWRSSFPG